MLHTLMNALVLAQSSPVYDDRNRGAAWGWGWVWIVALIVIAIIAAFAVGGRDYGGWRDRFGRRYGERGPGVAPPPATP